MDRKGLDENGTEDFDAQLRQAMRRQAAPLGLKQRVLARAREQRRRGERRPWWRVHFAQRIAASLVLVGICGGYAVYHQQMEERRRGEEAREQVMTAFRITNKTLDRVQERLADDRR